MKKKLDVGQWGKNTIKPGERGEVQLTLTENFSGSDVHIPIYILRAKKPGPTVFVSGAVHGDEINGTGAIRHIILEDPFELTAGSLILVPVVNILGFERHTRYLPDRRDLNRSFPGSSKGSLASRMASVVFEEIVGRADFGIDLHTGAVRRTNFPNVRADLKDPVLAEFARAFGASLIVSGRGPAGSLRRTASDAGVPTLLLEAGEIWKVEPTVLEYAVEGIKNCLIHLGMVDGERSEPPFRVETDATHWMRAQYGGFLQFHVAPGDIVEKDQHISTNTSLTGTEQNTVHAPREGIILGMTTLPAVVPGDPICHIAYTKKGSLKKIERAMSKLSDDDLHERMRDDLSKNMVLEDGED
ncbi:succinylglutamate desuccinylase/aspartoacylase family protein [bacterium]|nr:succinylglutamate desuccinylase/aspartoacylase family protein [bacterium]